jgi:hypothetical protein
MLAGAMYDSPANQNYFEKKNFTAKHDLILHGSTQNKICGVVACLLIQSGFYSPQKNDNQVEGSALVLSARNLPAAVTFRQSILVSSCRAPVMQCNLPSQVSTFH